MKPTHLMTARDGCETKCQLLRGVKPPPTLSELARVRHHDGTESWVQEKSLTAMVKAETTQIVVTARDMLLVAWTGQRSPCYLPSKQTAGTMPVRLAEKALLADTGLDVAESPGALE
jgi:hypothetical protein